MCCGQQGWRTFVREARLLLGNPLSESRSDKCSPYERNPIPLFPSAKSPRASFVCIDRTIGDAPSPSSCCALLRAPPPADCRLGIYTGNQRHGPCRTHIRGRAEGGAESLLQGSPLHISSLNAAGPLECKEHISAPLRPMPNLILIFRAAPTCLHTQRHHWARGKRFHMSAVDGIYGT